MAESDREANRFSARAARYARVGANVGGVAARIAGTRLFGRDGQDASNAAALAQALGGLKGPIMKVAQLLATIPDVVPPEYAAELQKLQSRGAADGGGLRQAADAGRARARLAGALRLLRPASPPPPPRSGRSTARPRRTARRSPASCSIRTCSRPWRRTSASSRSPSPCTAAWTPRSTPARSRKEIGERVREELDYEREAKHAALYAHALAGIAEVRVPGGAPNSRRGGSSPSAGSRARRS